MARLLEVFARFLRLGFAAFGGPLAHLGYFEREFVERARWLDRDAFAEMVALCSVLPGPTSSQVGMLIGAKRAGPAGSLAAWLGFTAPSAVILGCVGTAMRIVFTPVSRARHAHALVTTPPYVSDRYLTTHHGAMTVLEGALVGVTMTALAVVLFAVVSLARGIIRSRFARVFVGVSFAAALAQIRYAPSYVWTVLLLGAAVGAAFAPSRAGKSTAALPTVARAYGVSALGLWLAALIFVPIFAKNGYLALFAQTFRAGSLVFGGGHVVLSFLVPVSNVGVQPRVFQMGYGIAQAMPGPLFSFASYFGATDDLVSNPCLAAAVATIGIFLPSAFVLPAALCLWNSVAGSTTAQRILGGLTVSVVGLLAATFVSLVRVDVARGARPMDVVAFAVAYALLARARWPSWAVVVAMSAGSALYAALPLLPALQIV